MVLDGILRRCQNLRMAVVPRSDNSRYVYIVNGFGLGCLGLGNLGCFGLGLFGHVNWLVYTS